MAAWRQRLRAKSRSALRQLLWRIWPSGPASWSEVPVRLRPVAAQILRLTSAATVAFLAARLVSPGIRDLTAALAALLIVQATTVGTMRTGALRVGAVLIGVLVAVVVASILGLTWWSLALVVGVSLVLANLLRLGELTIEVPISGMVILAGSAPEAVAEVRVVNTLIGVAVGIGFGLLAPVAIPNSRATEALRRVARSQASLFEEIALALGERPPLQAEVQAWYEWSDDIVREGDVASKAVAETEETRRLNPRALATTRYPGLASALQRLERCLAAQRALIVVIGQDAPSELERAEDPIGADLRRVFAVVLDHLAAGLRAFGNLVQAEYAGHIDRIEAAFARTQESVRETRAVLTELTLLNVDPRERTDLWMVQSSVMLAVEQILWQIDIERPELGQEPWLQRQVEAVRPPAWLPGIGKDRES